MTSAGLKALPFNKTGLSLREFLVICQFFDLRKAANTPTTSILTQHGDGVTTSYSNTGMVKAQTKTAWFEVFEVKRDVELYVLCAGEDGELINLRFENYRPHTNVLEWRKTA